MSLRRAAQERMNEEFAHFTGRQGRHHTKRQPLDEGEHRKVLNLPVSGKLERRQVNTVFRRLTQKAHPDVGEVTNSSYASPKHAVLLETIA